MSILSALNLARRAAGPERLEGYGEILSNPKSSGTVLGNALYNLAAYDIPDFAMMLGGAHPIGKSTDLILNAMGLGDRQESLDSLREKYFLERSPIGYAENIDPKYARELELGTEILVPLPGGLLTKAPKLTSKVDDMVKVFRGETFPPITTKSQTHHVFYPEKSISRGWEPGRFVTKDIDEALNYANPPLRIIPAVGSGSPAPGIGIIKSLKIPKTEYNEAIKRATDLGEEGALLDKSTPMSLDILKTISNQLNDPRRILNLLLGKGLEKGGIINSNIVR